MLAFRLIFGLLLVISVLCFAMYIGTNQAQWRQRGVVVLKWTLLAALDKACLFGCEEYTDLKNAVARFKANGGRYTAAP